MKRKEKIAYKKKITGIDEAMIDHLVRAFYEKIRVDPILGPIFNERISNWEPHLLKMVDFWSSATLKSGRYKGNPMIIHNSMPIDSRFFDRWLTLFAKTVTEVCPPEPAKTFVEKANLIANSLELGIAVSNGSLPLVGERYIDQSLDYPEIDYSGE